MMGPKKLTVEGTNRTSNDRAGQALRGRPLGVSTGLTPRRAGGGARCPARLLPYLLARPTVDLPSRPPRRTNRRFPGCGCLPPWRRSGRCPAAAACTRSYESTFSSFAAREREGRALRDSVTPCFAADRRLRRSRRTVAQLRGRVKETGWPTETKTATATPMATATTARPGSGPGRSPRRCTPDSGTSRSTRPHT